MPDPIKTSARPWRVEARGLGSGPGSDWHKHPNFGFFATSENASAEINKWLAGVQIHAEYRVVNRDTAEVVRP